MILRDAQVSNVDFGVAHEACRAVFFIAVVIGNDAGD